jgi:alkylated DNA repair protein (DNA oxidative demethylase)
MPEQIFLETELHRKNHPPEGFQYVEDIVSPDEEKELITFGESLTFQPFVMRGQASRRGIVRFGTDYDRPVGGVSAVVPEIPSELLWLRDRAAAQVGVDPKVFTSAVMTRYPIGATIGWHRDMPMFGPVVLGISLNSLSQLRLRKIENPSETFRMTLAPRSLFVLSGAARHEWHHSIPPVKALRYSITFRSLM